MKRTPSQPPKRARAKMREASRSKPRKIECWKGEDDSGGDGLPGVSGGLHDVVFKDAGLARRLGEMEMEKRTEMGMEAATVEAGAEAYVDGDGSEEDAEEGSEDEGSGGEFGAGLCGGDEGFEDGLGWCGGCHDGDASPAWLGWMFSASMECISGED